MSIFFNSAPNSFGKHRPYRYLHGLSLKFKLHSKIVLAACIPKPFVYAVLEQELFLC
jgi:hypothetical protein